jgi:hypothetical protein
MKTPFDTKLLSDRVFATETSAAQAYRALGKLLTARAAGDEIAEAKINEAREAHRQLEQEYNDWMLIKDTVSEQSRSEPQ